MKTCKRCGEEITDADCYDVCVECEFLQRTGEIDR